MSSVGGKVATGATWMLGLRLFQRSMGLISTVILARLLVPEDFGLVAMAMAVYALVEILGAFGFDLALIRDQKAERLKYDTAWTLNIAYKTLGAIGMVIAAPIVADFFGDPRVEAVLYAFALIAFLNGLENIGIVAFRKDLAFSKEFAFQFTKAFGRVAVTISSAFILQNYWALVIGSLAGAIIGLVLSYLLHPFRPKLSLSESKSLFSFSVWILLNNFAMYGHQRGGDLIVGHMSGAASLGAFRVSTDIAKLPTANLYAPIMNAVFPGFAKIVHDLARLRRAYLLAQGVVTTVTVPAALGIASVAEPLVWALLGENWLVTIPLIQVLALAGALGILQSTRHSLFMALGKPYLVFVFMLANVFIALPLLAFLLSMGVELHRAVWANVVALLILMPAGTYVVSHFLELRVLAFLGVIWRPVIAGAAMTTVLLYTQNVLPEISGLAVSLMQLAVLVPLGFLFYGGLLLALWLGCGRVEGAESWLIEVAMSRGILIKKIGNKLLHPDSSRAYNDEI